MRYCALVVLSMLFLSGCGGPGPVVWKQSFDCGASEEAAGLALTGNGLVAVGNKTAGSKTSWVIQAMGKDGKLLWRKDYSQGEAGVCGDVATDDRDDIFVAGTSRIKGSEMCVVVKYRANGTMAWQRAVAVGDASRANGIVPLDSGLVICGAVKNKDEQDLLVARLDAEGKTVWSKNFNFGPLDEGVRVAVNPAGNIVVTGRSGKADNPDIVLLSLNGKGDSLWSRTYDSGEEDEPGDVAFDVFGNVLAVGTGRTLDSLRCVVLEYHPDGELIRKTAFAQAGQARGNAVVTTADGDIFAAATGQGVRNTRLLAFQYKPNASTIWERILELPNVDVAASDLVFDSDVFVLATVNPKAGNPDMMVARLSGPGTVKPAAAKPGQ